MWLQQLHWLPIKYRTMFKLLTIAYNAIHGKDPHYLKEKIKMKALSQNHQTIDINQHNSGYPIKQEKVIC